MSLKESKVMSFVFDVISNQYNRYFPCIKEEKKNALVWEGRVQEVYNLMLSRFDVDVTCCMFLFFYSFF